MQSVHEIPSVKNSSGSENNLDDDQDSINHEVNKVTIANDSNDDSERQSVALLSGEQRHLYSVLTPTTALNSNSENEGRRELNSEVPFKIDESEDANEVDNVEENDSKDSKKILRKYVKISPKSKKSPKSVKKLCLSHNKKCKVNKMTKNDKKR